MIKLTDKVENLERRVAALELFLQAFKPHTAVIDPDVLLADAIKIITEYENVSVSLLQRRLSLGYAHAARIMDQLEGLGFVGPAIGSKPRDVLRNK